MTFHQEKIFKEIAKQNNISLERVKEVYMKVCEKVVRELSSFNEDEDRIYNMDSFKTVYIQNFGRFVPDKKKILAVNNARKKRKESNSNPEL